MKKIASIGCGLIALALGCNPLQAPAQGCSSQLSSISSVFTNALPVLRSKTSVPVRLPACVRGLNSKDELYAIVKTAEKSGYVVVLGAIPDCEGQHVCSYGTMVGTSGPLNQIGEYDLAHRSRVSVKLRRGLTGFYYASVCHAYCSDSLITWSEGSYHYIIGLKSGNLSSLVASANSAIGASPAQ